MKLNHNPYGLYEKFKLNAKELLIKKFKANEIDLSMHDIYKFVGQITFKSTDLDLQWDNSLSSLIDENTISELDLLWMKILNP